LGDSEMSPPDELGKSDKSRERIEGHFARGQYDHIDVARTLKAEYMAGTKDASVRGLDAVHALLMDLYQPGMSADELVKKVARMVFTQFNLREVSVGLRCEDGLYRYVAQHGMRAEVWAAHQKLVYNDQELFDPKKYKYTSISKYTRLFLAEDEPYDDDERGTYSEHLSTKSVRRSPKDSKEGDYLDFLILGPKEEVLGWIETSGTWDGRIPDARTIRSIEIMASLVGLALTGVSAEPTRRKA